MNDETKFLHEVLKGDENAIAFVQALFQISQAWDDVVDGDGSDGVDLALTHALLVLPTNPFYARYFANLFPLVQAAVFDWKAANVLERGSEHDKTLAFMLRDSLTAVVQQCAYLVGGTAWAIEQSPHIRRFFHDETLADYLEGLKGVEP